MAFHRQLPAPGRNTVIIASLPAAIIDLTMSGFRAVNTTLTVPEPPPGHSGEETTPTTPRPNKLFGADQHLHHQHDQRYVDEQSAKTPTRDSFGGLAGQRPLPSDASPPQQDSKKQQRNSTLRRGNSDVSAQSVDNKDVVMDDEDGHAASENESVNSDSRPTKKKKGQRFFCTDFPPCQLSFTRSEHLARHIRFVVHVSLAARATDKSVENTLVKGPSSATATVASPVWTIFVSMPRPST